MLICKFSLVIKVFLFFRGRNCCLLKLLEQYFAPFQEENLKFNNWQGFGKFSFPFDSDVLVLYVLWKSCYTKKDCCLFVLWCSYFIAFLLVFAHKRGIHWDKMKELKKRAEAEGWQHSVSNSTQSEMYAFLSGEFVCSWDIRQGLVSFKYKVSRILMDHPGSVSHKGTCWFLWAFNGSSVFSKFWTSKCLQWALFSLVSSLFLVFSPFR